MVTMRAPLMTPTTNPAMSPSRMAGKRAQPNCASIMAVTTALRPQIEPTDRSMPQIRMTNSSPMDRMAV